MYSVYAMLVILFSRGKTQPLTWTFTVQMGRHHEMGNSWTTILNLIGVQTESQIMDVWDLCEVSQNATHVK